MGQFRPSYKGIGKLLTSNGMQAEMQRRAGKMLEAAQADAPDDAEDIDGDHYRDHFHVESGVRTRKTTRAYGRLTNDHPAAVEIEFGTKDTPAHNTVARALDSAKD